MNIFINKLPTDIINYIIPYTYKCQNKTLLDDIINYKETKDRISNVYYDFWITNVEVLEPEDKYWLINDIFAYANNYQATMYGYIEKFYNIFRRNLHLKTYEDIHKYMSILDTKPVNSQINIFWGLLTSSERNDVIHSFHI